MRDLDHLVGSATAVMCVIALAVAATPARAEAAARVAEPGLRVDRLASGELRLTWPGSCLASDDDFEVYAGALGDPGSFAPVACTTGGLTTLSFVPAAGGRMFLVVPRNATNEGSYGIDGAGDERRPAAGACLPQEVGVCPIVSPLAGFDDPTAGYRESYDSTQAEVELQLLPPGPSLRGYVVASGLKPHFTYQVKLAGVPGTPSNEAIGLTGRWWQEDWSGSAWVNGQNLNDKGDGSSPSPNDVLYSARRDVADATSPTGLHYRFTGYLPFEYFTTDAGGCALLAFEQHSSYHTDDPETTVTVFGEWERLPPGGVPLPAEAAKPISS